MFLINDSATKVTFSLITDTVSSYIRDRLSRMCSICNIHLRVKSDPQREVCCRPTDVLNTKYIL
jgi:hypothetical protein